MVLLSRSINLTNEKAISVAISADDVKYQYSAINLQHKSPETFKI